MRSRSGRRRPGSPACGVWLHDDARRKAGVGHSAATATRKLLLRRIDTMRSNGAPMRSGMTKRDSASPRLTSSAHGAGAPRRRRILRDDEAEPYCDERISLRVATSTRASARVSSAVRSSLPTTTGTTGARAVAEANADGALAPQHGAGVRLLRQHVIGGHLRIGPAQRVDADGEARPRRGGSSLRRAICRGVGHLTSRARVATRIAARKNTPKVRPSAATRMRSRPALQTRCRTGRALLGPRGMNARKCTTGPRAAQDRREERVEVVRGTAASRSRPSRVHQLGWRR